jgi:hypothetical protein
METKAAIKALTGYNIGHEFWVARVYDRYVEDSIEIDGKKYVHMAKRLEPVAKRKRIERIEIKDDVDDGFGISFWCRDIDDRYHVIDCLCNVAKEEFANEELAFAFAVKWIEEQGTSYHGPKLA